MVPQITSVALESIDASKLRSKQSVVKAWGDEGAVVGTELGKKKRTNRTAKLKQCKLDARREQWLSQVKDKGRKHGNGDSSPSIERSGSPENSDDRSVRDGNEDLELHDSDVESPMDRSGHEGSSQESSGASSSSGGGGGGGSCSGSASVNGDDDDDASYDDWEAVADALGRDDSEKLSVEPSVGGIIRVGSAPADSELRKNLACFSTEVVTQGILRPEYKGKPSCFEKNRIDRATTCRAWRPDDASRPLSLPTLSKQMSFPAPSERHLSRGPINWGRLGTDFSHPSSCPICYEDLDLTDSSFCPCSCGFRLCLFCHKRILEADGRCPGCRKHYEPAAAATKGPPPAKWLSRSCSMRI